MTREEMIKRLEFIADKPGCHVGLMQKAQAILGSGRPRNPAERDADKERSTVSIVLKDLALQLRRGRG